MDITEKLITSLTVLLTGFVVVFAVLLILIGIIKGYGILVMKFEKMVKEKKAQKETASAKPVAPVQQKPVQVTETAESGISDEIVAVIAAAVDSMYGSSGKARIKSIKKSDNSRSAWSKAGILDNTRPF